jgi:CheY-like chemotaxis protein
MPKILLVDDNELNRDMLSRRLKRRDFEVEMAVDGQEGVDLTRSLMPDLILMDMSLPIIDGWTATGILKSDSSTCHIPVIALTAHAMEGDRQKCLEAGCDDFDTKPIEFKRLLDKINHWLETGPDKIS